MLEQEKELEVRRRGSEHLKLLKTQLKYTI